MQSRRHAPHSVVSHNPSQAKCCDHLSEGCIWGDDTQSQTCGHTYRETKQNRAVVAVIVVAVVMFLSPCKIFPYCCSGKNVLFFFFLTIKAMKRKKTSTFVMIHSFSETSKELISMTRISYLKSNKVQLGSCDLSVLSNKNYF